MRITDLALRLLGATSGETILRGAAAASGTITLPAGTTDFSATGGASQVVRQSTAGGALTVGQLAAADVTGALAGNQTITLSGDIAGSGATAITTTLPNVNANTGTFQGLTVNAKGQVTAAANQSYLTSTGVSGMTAGQLPVAATGTTITSSVPYGTTGNNTVVQTGATGVLAAGVLPAHTGDVTSPAGSVVNTLATVNANVGTFQGLTVNAKGLVTAAVNQSYAPLASPSFTGNVSMSAGLTVTNAIISVTGFQARSGIPGPAQANVFNIDWAGTPAAHLWIDSVNAGQFSFTCDYRYKTDVVELPSMWDRVKALRPVSYHIKAVDELLIKANPAEYWGLIAHELQETLIETAASGHKDAPNIIQAPNILLVLATLTKGLQEAMERIEALEAACA